MNSITNFDMDTAVLERRASEKICRTAYEKKKSYEEAVAEIKTARNSDTVIKSSPRHGWAEAAKEFAESGNEEVFFPDFFDDENLNWWQWKQK